MQRRALLLSTVALQLPTAARAQAQPTLAGPVRQVQLAGVMGTRAMLVFDGQPQLMVVGDSARGVRLVSLQAEVAVIDRDGATLSLRLGASPVAVGAGLARAGASREIVLTAGPGGHFITSGAINGRAVSFMVDTGATAIAMSQSEASRIGLDLRNGQRALGNTANGAVPLVMLTLTRVRVGEIEVANVQSVVMPAQMPYVLLGNSFLSRFQMRRENDVMRLELRR
ncbi:MAG: retroviral-like aspartic protease family protein [Rubrivivax sp.]|nr:retroviral-like aspartic protease family protein [Rubrivivax sp.]MBK7262866.1 retroviral-like aspartic protease family protein [Rubrivivax sp.]MBK8528765.1 retroviral-like aspartic protease family protein [Rubrivivax sp.]